MTRHEKLILLLVALVVLGWAASFGKELALASYYDSAPIPNTDKALLAKLNTLLYSLVNVGAAIWLGIEARAAALKAWVWALFGLFFGPWGVGLFYLVQLYTRQHKT